MTDPDRRPDGGRAEPGGPRYRRLVLLARLVLLWEALWPRLWPAVGAAGLLLAAALSGLLPRLPLGAHVVVLGTGLAAILALLVRGVRGLRMPDRQAARRRLERDSDLNHRPLGTVADRQAAGRGDALSEALWRTHLLRTAGRLRDLRVAWPSPGLARRDPRALRAVVVLLLVVGFGVGHGPVGERLQRALLPAALTTPADLAVDLWLTPPDYTGLAPRHLRRAATEPLPVPAGSRATVQVAGTDAAPSLRTGGDAPVAFEALGEGSWRAEAAVEAAGPLVVEGTWGELARWPVDYIPDQPPEIAFAAPPQAVEGGRLQLAWQGQDDYGLREVALLVSRDDAAGAAETLRLPLPAPGPGEVVRGRGLKDLSAHRWAGLPVTLRLEAVDAAGQRGRSPAIEAELPRRTFHHPVARAIAEQRRRLVDAGLAVRAEVARALRDLTDAPETYQGDATVHLALGVAAQRLWRGRAPGTVAEVRELLWKTALRLEDGGLSLAEREMERLSRELQQAMAEGAGEAELARLSEALARATERYLAALARQMRQAPQTSSGAAEQTLAGDMLRRLSEAIGRAAAAGDRQAVARRLAELREMTERLGRGLRSQAARERLAEAGKLMDSLRRLAQEQKDLLDRTYETLRREAPSDQAGAMAREQMALRRSLSRALRRSEGLLGEAPPSLPWAGEAMDDAQAGLASGRPRDAVAAQGSALDGLRQALDETLEALRRGNGGIGLGLVPGDAPGRGRDPFGRAPQGPVGGPIEGEAEIPGEGQRRRIDAILQELRRRANDPARPERERDYLRRLLERF